MQEQSPQNSDNTASAYLPRNVVNAPELKVSITTRSLTRRDPACVQAWLENHFFRWLVGSFGHAVEIQSMQQLALILGGADQVPAWFIKQSSAGTIAATFYIDAVHPELRATENKLVEFLNARRGTRLAEKLQRITCPMALDMWQKEHARMQAKRGKGWVPSSGLGLREMAATANGHWFEFIPNSAQLREEMAYESYHMRHCLGQFANIKHLSGGYGEQYANQTEQGQLRLFTLRGPGNLPHVTISLRQLENGVEIDQIKGKQNCPPIQEYNADVLQWLQQNVPQGQRHPDCDSMGLVFEPDEATGGRWKFIHEAQDLNLVLNMATHHPHLINHFERPPAALQWLLLSLGSGHLKEAKNCNAAVCAAAWTTSPQDPPNLTCEQPVPTWYGAWQTPPTQSADPTPLWIDHLPVTANAHWLKRLFTGV
jgi:hypothetical protein